MDVMKLCDSATAAIITPIRMIASLGIDDPMVFSSSFLFVFIMTIIDLFHLKTDQRLEFFLMTLFQLCLAHSR